MWMYLGLLSALFLGLHSLCKKHAVQGNEVLPVLLGTLLAGFLVFIPFFIGSVYNPEYFQQIGFYITPISIQTHGFIFIKSIIMTGSWVLAYAALKHLPITIVTPIRSAGPFFTLNPQTLQFWFCFYTILILLIILSITWFPKKEKRKAFKFRWTIIAVGVLLQTADYFYFKALQDPDALIMLLSAIKRSQIIIAVVIGGLLFREHNKRKKLIPLAGILIGVFLILYS